MREGCWSRCSILPFTTVWQLCYASSIIVTGLVVPTFFSLTPANESSLIPLVSFAQYKQLGKLLQSYRRDAALWLKARILLPKEPYLHLWDIHLPRVPLSSTNQSCYQINQSWDCLWLNYLQFSTNLPSSTFSNKHGIDAGELNFLGWSHRTWFHNLKHISMVLKSYGIDFSTQTKLGWLASSLRVRALGSSQPFQLAL